jgi:hypothetical protein
MNLRFDRRVVGGEFVEWNVKLGGKDSCFASGNKCSVSSFRN